MATIYGRSGSEKKLISLYSDSYSSSINGYYDIDSKIKALLDRKGRETMQFYEELPKLIENKTSSVEEIDKEIPKTEASFNEKIKTINLKKEEIEKKSSQEINKIGRKIRSLQKKKILDIKKIEGEINEIKKKKFNEKTKYSEQKYINYIQKFYRRRVFYVKRKREINKHERLIYSIEEDARIILGKEEGRISKIEKDTNNSLQFEDNKLTIVRKNRDEAIKGAKQQKECIQEEIRELKENPTIVLNRRISDIIGEIDNLEKIKKSQEYIGAYGELQVLNKLKELNAKYNILCDLNVELDDYVGYRGKHDLGSAQMDFVVVSNKGIFIIEVKNWSNNFYHNYNGLKPHEQIDRAGRILYLTLKDAFGLDIGSKITKVLLPTQRNMEYDPEYKSVLVKNIHSVNSFIENKKDVLSNEAVDDITNELKRYIN